MQKASDVAEMVFSKILIKSLNLAENPYKIPKFGGKTNYIQKIGGDIISRNSTFFMYASIPQSQPKSEDCVHEFC